jgi:hypothetical protein
MTGREMLGWWLTNLVALVLAIAVSPIAFVAAVPAWALAFYRSQRRASAVRRAGLTGFVQQAPRVSDEERERKIAAIRRELGDWGPGLAWLNEVVDARAAGRYE